MAVEDDEHSLALSLVGSSRLTSSTPPIVARALGMAAPTADFLSNFGASGGDISTATAARSVAADSEQNQTVDLGFGLAIGPSPRKGDRGLVREQDHPDTLQSQQSMTQRHRSHVQTARSTASEPVGHTDQDDTRPGRQRAITTTTDISELEHFQVQRPCPRVQPAAHAEPVRGDTVPQGDRGLVREQDHPDTLQSQQPMTQRCRSLDQSSSATASVPVGHTDQDDDRPGRQRAITDISGLDHSRLQRPRTRVQPSAQEEPVRGDSVPQVDPRPSISRPIAPCQEPIDGAHGGAEPGTLNWYRQQARSRKFTTSESLKLVELRWDETELQSIYMDKPKENQLYVFEPDKSWKLWYHEQYSWANKTVLDLGDLGLRIEKYSGCKDENGKQVPNTERLIKRIIQKKGKRRYAIHYYSPDWVVGDSSCAGPSRDSEIWLQPPVEVVNNAVNNSSDDLITAQSPTSEH